jgi:hypothetical protein
MDDFENKLKRLPLAKPSDGLRQNIFGSPQLERPTLFGFPGRRIAVGWAAVLAIAVGLAGFSMGALLGRRSLDVASTQTSVEVRIVEATSTAHNFDLTGTSPKFLMGDLNVEVESEKEI